MTTEAINETYASNAHERHARRCIERLESARAFIDGAIDHVKRGAIERGGRPQQRLNRLEVAASDIGSAARACADAALELAMSLAKRPT